MHTASIPSLPLAPICTCAPLFGPFLGSRRISIPKKQSPSLSRLASEQSSWKRRWEGPMASSSPCARYCDLGRRSEKCITCVEGRSRAECGQSSACIFLPSPCLHLPPGRQAFSRAPDRAETLRSPSSDAALPSPALHVVLACSPLPAPFRESAQKPLGRELKTVGC